MSSRLTSGPYRKLIIPSSMSQKNQQETLIGGINTSALLEPPPTTLRTPRFVEATSVHSPVEPSRSSQSHFPCAPSPCHIDQSHLSEIGFRYMEPDRPQHHAASVEAPQVPVSSPKSMFKVLEYLSPKDDNPCSPTFQEQILERHEEFAEKEQAKDLKVKIRVRMAKFILRGVSFGCSLIVLAMISMSFSIFHASKHLPPRNHLPPWAAGTKTWPQTLVLVISCISLASCILVFWCYYRGGHRRAEKVAVIYTLLAVAFFILSSVMWGIAAGVLQGSRNHSLNKDMWGWSCVDNKRRQLFSEKVDYALVCRMQSWTLVCCIIEIVLESITILLYGVVFYRYHSKQRLRKTIDTRDRARFDLYLARAQSESSPNPLLSPYTCPPGFTQVTWQKNSLSVGKGPSVTRIVEARPTSALTEKPFVLQSPPIKNLSATLGNKEFGIDTPVTCSQEHIPQNVIAGTGEQTYDVVPIPSPYKMPMASPGLSTNYPGI